MRVLFVCALLAFTVCGARGQEGLGDFIPTLNALDAQGRFALHAKPTKLEISSWEAASKEADPQISFPALVHLWLTGRHEDFIQLEWWKKRENARLGRVLIMSFYECAFPKSTPAKPDFQADQSRFAENEKQRRQVELGFVRSERQTIAGILAKVIQECPPGVCDGNMEKMLAHYKKTAGAK